MLSQPSKKLLVIGHVWPEPTASAAGSHMLSLISMFQNKDYEVNFWCGAKVNENPQELASLGIQTGIIELNDSSFDDLISQLSPDIVLFDRFMTEEQFGWRVTQQCPEALRLLDTEDLHCLRHARHQALKKDIPVEEVLLTSDISKREIASIYRSDAALVLSQAEIAILQSTFKVPANLLIHSPFMLEFNKTQHKPYEDREHFAWIGNFLHAPNWDAVLRLRESIWPLIRKRLPKAEMHIYGAYAADKAYALNNKKLGFRILGRAEDANEVLESAKLCLAPLRFGAGLKGKLSDAMLVGTPNITTTIGAEGMIDESQAVSHWPGFITDDEQVFVDSAIEHYQNKELWLIKQRLGYELIEHQFDVKKNSDRLFKNIESVLNNLDEHRQNNFYGQMLNHHHHKSSEYMSRWIEAKNEVIKLKQKN